MQNQSSSNNASIWWQVGLLIVVSIIAVFIGLKYDQGDDFLEEARLMPSIFNQKQSGLMALYEVATKGGMHCEAWQGAYRELKDVTGTLVMVGPTQLISDAEFEQISKWVSQGNQLIYLDSFSLDNGKEFLKGLHLKVRQVHAVSNRTIKPQSIPETTLVPDLTISARARIFGGKVVLRDEYGPLIVETEQDKGRILIGSVPGLCSNRNITDPKNWANFQFLLNWLSTTNGTVYFDERCHGYSGSGNVFVYVMRGWLGPVIFQLFALLFIAVISSHQRFGELAKSKDRREISNLEFINGLANAYERSGATFAALEIIVQDFRNKICRLINVSPHSSNLEIISNLQSSSVYSNLQKFLADYERLAKEKNISISELSQQVKMCDLLTEQIQSEYRAQKSGRLNARAS
jgi:Domain of unknown function (DUF4350)